MGEGHTRHQCARAMVLDVSQSPWPIASADGIIYINRVHISPWDATLGLIRGAAAILPPTAPFYLYGPYKREGVRNDPEQPSVRLKRSPLQPDLGSARPRSGRRDRAIRRILGSDIHRDARKQSERRVPPHLTRRCTDEPQANDRAEQPKFSDTQIGPKRPAR